MRVAVASSGLGHVTRGIEAWAADLAAALRHEGVDVSLMQGGGRAVRDPDVVVPCCQRASPRNRHLRRLLPARLGWRLGMGSPYEIEQTSFSLGLCDQLRRRRIDILHVQDPRVALWTQYARRLGWIRTKTILAHGTEEPLEFQRRIIYLQHLAPWHLEQARAAGICRPDWIALPNFIDTQRFQPGTAEQLRGELRIPPHARVILCAAAIKRHHKRIDWLLDEMAQLIQHHPMVNAWLVVAGGRETDTEQLMARGTSLLGDRVRFLVQFPRERMPQLYRLADLFVLASLKEMMPIALLEALASGVPCLVHPHPVMQWMVGPGGVHVDMTDRGALAHAAAALLCDQTRRSQLAGDALRHCREQFGTRQVVRQIIEYYHQVHQPAAQPARCFA